MANINEAAVLKLYLDTQEYSDRLTAIEAQAASSLATQQTEVAAAIAQVNLAQSQTITALTLEVNNLKTDLTDSITATQTNLINRADQLAQEVADITDQLTQDKAAFTQEIQDALVYLQDEASVASALRTPRKIQGVDFDGTQDINLPVFTSELDGLVPKRVGATTTKYLREDGTWAVPSDTTYALLTKASAEEGTATDASTISAKVLKEAIQYHAPTVTDIAGNAETATKLANAHTISLTGAVTGSVSFDGSDNASITTTVEDTVAIEKGGTGATTAEEARTNLDVYSKSEVTTAIANATPTIPNATETVAGKAKIATTAIAQAGVNDSDIITPLKLKDTVFGLGQTRKVVTKTSGVTYTNTTGKPIGFEVVFKSTRTSSNYVMNCNITVNSEIIQHSVIYAGTLDYRCSMFVIILPAESYSFNAVNASIIEKVTEIS